MRIRKRWFAVLVPMIAFAVLEAASDSILDPLLPFPNDTILVVAAASVLAVAYGAYVFNRIDALTATLRERNAELEARHAAAAALYGVSVAISSLVEIEAILAAIVENARSLLRAEVAVLVLDETGDEQRLGSWSGPDGAVDPSGSQAGEGFERFVVPAYRTWHVAAPLRRAADPIGALMVGGRGTRTQGIRDLETLSSLATQASIALENDRLQRQLRESAVRGERERIAREMHDGLAQVLGYVNTKSQAVEEFLVAGKLDAARVQLSELATAARSVYVDVREAILGLTSPISPERGLVGALEEYTARFSEASKLAVLVEADDASRAVVLAPDVEAQLFRIVQEALTNVRKHAGARRAVVRLTCDAESLEVSVVDDGRGMPAAATVSADWPHYGLQTMRERAEAIGASLVLEPASGGGAEVRVLVPLASGRRGH